LQKVFENKDVLSQEEINELNEIQLRWDKELSELNNEEKRFASIKNTVSSVLKNWLKIILKSSNISSDVKQNLLNWMRYI